MLRAGKEQGDAGIHGGRFRHHHQRADFSDPRTAGGLTVGCRDNRNEKPQAALRQTRSALAIGEKKRHDGKPGMASGAHLIVSGRSRLWVWARRGTALLRSTR